MLHVEHLELRRDLRLVAAGRRAPHAERRRADPDHHDRHRAPHHVAAAPPPRPPARLPRSADRAATGPPLAGSSRAAAWSPRRRRRRTRPARCSSRLSRRSCAASVRQTSHPARCALARSSSAPASSPSIRAEISVPRWLIAPAPAVPGARGRPAAARGRGGCGCAPCRASRPWWPRSPRRRTPRCRTAPPPPGNPAAAPAAPPGCPRRGGCRPRPGRATPRCRGSRWATSSPRPSNLIRCRRRAPSRNRLVVIRCSQPSKVPGV